MHLIEMVIEREKTIFEQREEIFVVENDEIAVEGKEPFMLKQIFIYSLF